MRKLFSALVAAAMLITPGLASAHDGRDRWDDRDRREWRDHRGHDRHWRDERRWREGRRHWRDHDRREWRRDRWRDRRYGYYDRRRIVCRTYWDYGYPERVCWRR